VERKEQKQQEKDDYNADPLNKEEIMNKNNKEYISSNSNQIKI